MLIFLAWLKFLGFCFKRFLCDLLENLLRVFLGAKKVSNGPTHLVCLFHDLCSVEFEAEVLSGGVVIGVAFWGRGEISQENHLAELSGEPVEFEGPEDRNDIELE